MNDLPKQRPDDRGPGSGSISATLDDLAESLPETVVSRLETARSQALSRTEISRSSFRLFARSWRPAAALAGICIAIAVGWTMWSPIEPKPIVAIEEVSEGIDFYAWLESYGEFVDFAERDLNES